MNTTDIDTKTPFILEVKGNSLDDGPGIRSVVFYKGCPLSCVWCHNPESKRAVAEISFDAGSCVDCGTCRTVCPENALSPGSRYYVDRDRCTLCYRCADACPSGALARVGRKMSIDEILARVMPDLPFFRTSGGGVTLSGGEPTLYMEFTARLLEALRHNGISSLIETCGFFDADRFLELLYPNLDMIYFDLKIIDRDAHAAFCGVPNDRILENFRRLLALTQRDGKTLLPRTPLVPGITDTDANISGIADFLVGLGVSEAALLAYNPLWHEKSDKVGAEDTYRNDRSMASFSERSVLDRCRAIFSGAGIRC